MRSIAHSMIRHLIGPFPLLIMTLALYHPRLCMAEPTARVIMLKGQVRSLFNGQSIDLKLSDWVEENAEIHTEEKSFAKLELKDRSMLTIGPKSKMKISKGPEKGTGLINLISGQLRANVQKTQNGTTPKLIIKTKNAAMGVRGTEFETSFNQASGLSNLLTFEGQVASIQVEAGQSFSLNQLSSELSSEQVILVNPGQYTAINAQSTAPMEPVRINPAQLSSLKSNETLLPVESGPSNKEYYQSPVPPGASVSALTNTSTALDSSLAQSLGEDGMQLAQEIVSSEQPTQLPNAEGDTGAIREGGFYDPRIGYIVPSANSPIDPNTGLPIPTSDVGGVSSDGQYLPPKGLTVTDEGKFVTTESLSNTSSEKSASASVPIIPSAITSTEEAVSFKKMETIGHNMPSLSSSTTDALVDKIVQTNTTTISDTQNTNTSISNKTNVDFNVSISD